MHGVRAFALLGLACLTVWGCARTWKYTKMEDLRVDGPAAVSTDCKDCHEGEYASWKHTRHGDATRMSRVSVESLRECGACHESLPAHSADPQASAPPSLGQLGKSEQNAVCGKCHFNQELFGRRAINPGDRHALFTSVGFEGWKKQLSCLECHSGHQGKSEMLINIKAQVCFRCHKGAIATMGIFQPINYATAGKACQACHSVHGGSAAARWTRMGTGFCVVCHYVGVALVGE